LVKLVKLKLFLATAIIAASIVLPPTKHHLLWTWLTMPAKCMILVMELKDLSIKK
jgi:hypothetical protein